MIRRIALIAVAALWALSAQAQWQVPTNTIPIGRGAGVVGFGSTLPSATGSLCLKDTVPPSFVACSAGTADVVGPGSSTDNAIARFDGTTGKLLQNSTVTLGDTGNIVTSGTIASGAATVTGAITATSNISPLGGGPIREVLTAARTYYVRTDGNNANTGLVDSAGGAKLTIQGAVDAIKKLDCAGFIPTIQVRDGTYTSATTIDGPACLNPGATGLILVGNTGTPANVVLSTTSASAITFINTTHTTIAGGFKITVATSGSGLFVSNSDVDITGAMEYGAIASNGIDAPRGRVNITASYTISGGGIGHWHAGTVGSEININSAITITLTGTPAFSAYFAGARSGGRIYPDLATFSGAASAGTTKFLVHINGTIDAQNHDVTFLPGGTAGVLGWNGQYVSNQAEYNLEAAWVAYTPTVTASTGTFTTVSATGFYQRQGKKISFRAVVIITTIGSATGRMLISVPVGTMPAVGAGQANGVITTGLPVLCTGFFDTNVTVSCVKSTDALFPGTSGNTVYIFGSYQAS